MYYDALYFTLPTVATLQYGFKKQKWLYLDLKAIHQDRRFGPYLFVWPKGATSLRMIHYIKFALRYEGGGLV